jgi:ATP-dependent HslUV protease subunit HslV
MTRAVVRSTTVIAVARDGRIAMASDGQVTIGNTVVKAAAQKVRASSNGQALIGFAGGAADAMALTERLEAKLDAHPGNVRRAVVELAKDWRTDRVLRRLEAMLVVGSPDGVLVVSGNGDIIGPTTGSPRSDREARTLAAARAAQHRARRQEIAERSRSPPRSASTPTTVLPGKAPVPNCERTPREYLQSTAYRPVRREAAARSTRKRGGASRRRARHRA